MCQHGLRWSTCPEHRTVGRAAVEGTAPQGSVKRRAGWRNEPPAAASAVIVLDETSEEGEVARSLDMGARSGVRPPEGAT